MPVTITSHQAEGQWRDLCRLALRFRLQPEINPNPKKFDHVWHASKHVQSSVQHIVINQPSICALVRHARGGDTASGSTDSCDPDQLDSGLTELMRSPALLMLAHGRVTAPRRDGARLLGRR